MLADFSFPQNSIHQRGYISYEGLMNNKDVIYFSSWITYVHHQNRLNYPAETAGAHISHGIFHSDRCFKDAQTALQFQIHEIK